MKEKKKEKKARGRPTDYNQEIANLICERVAAHDFGIKKLCDMFPDMPVPDTIRLWRWRHPEFSAQYAKAKAFQGELTAEEILDIADDGRNDWMESLGEDGKPLGWKVNGEHVQRSRLRIDTRKWIASKLAPKLYGQPALSKNLEDGKSAIELLLNEGTND